jgi:hypothetical protein
VITDGSVQADENMYWYAAQALAKAKQNARVATGLDAAYNPFWQLLDASAGVGLAGHSYGAAGVSRADDSWVITPRSRSRRR